MGKVIKLYLKTGTQIFISIDNISKYSTKTIKDLTNHTIIKLSKCGNELDGWKWEVNTIKTKKRCISIKRHADVSYIL